MFEISLIGTNTNKEPESEMSSSIFSKSLQTHSHVTLQFLRKETFVSCTWKQLFPAHGYGSFPVPKLAVPSFQPPQVFPHHFRRFAGLFLELLQQFRLLRQQFAHSPDAWMASPTSPGSLGASCGVSVSVAA